VALADEKWPVMGLRAGCAGWRSGGRARLAVGPGEVLGSCRAEVAGDAGDLPRAEVAECWWPAARRGGRVLVTCRAPGWPRWPSAGDLPRPSQSEVLVTCCARARARYG